MQVILLADVDNLGLRGDVVEVARGYARNFLLPRRLAETATPGRLAHLRRRDELRARQEAKTHDEAQAIADTLTSTVLRFDVNAGPTGALFGSVTATDVADEIWKARRIRVDRRRVDLEPIKRIGRYTVPIDLFEGVRAEVETLVVPEGGELPPEQPAESPAEDGGEAAPEGAAEAVDGAAEAVDGAAERVEAATEAAEPVDGDAEAIEVAAERIEPSAEVPGAAAATDGDELR